MSKPAVGLTTWFYIAALDGSLHAMPYHRGRRILELGTAAVKPVVPASWLDRNGGLVLIGVGLVLQMGRPAYVDRCSVSFHATATTRRREVVPETVVDFEGLALRVLTDADAGRFDVKLLDAFLRAGHSALLLEDMFALMQANRADLEPVWIGHLLAGRQSYALFDLRTGELHPSHTPLRLNDAAAHWRRGRRPGPGYRT